MHSFRMTLAECDQLSAGLYPGFAVLVSTTAMIPLPHRLYRGCE